MGTCDRGRLFHAIVFMGAALTGSGAISACGGTTGDGSVDTGDAASDGPVDGHYDAIVAPSDHHVSDSYAQISIDTGPGDAPGAAEASPDAPADAGPDCYPCIAPPPANDP